MKRAVIRSEIEPFNYAGVQLRESTFKTQFDGAVELLWGIPNDNILKGFRERAGFDAPGQDLGGWYTADDDWFQKQSTTGRLTNLFSCFGQWLGALARMYKPTGDERIKQKLMYLLHEWARCIDDDGFFFYGVNPNAPHYEFDKVVGGLVDVYEYTGEACAVEYLERIVRWAEKHLNRRKIPASPDYFTGGESFGGEEVDNEWYTLILKGDVI